VVKAWCTDLGVEIASLGVQVHGGMGYIEETGAAQYLRDARIVVFKSMGKQGKSFASYAHRW